MKEESELIQRPADSTGTSRRGGPVTDGKRSTGAEVVSPHEKETEPVTAAVGPRAPRLRVTYLDWVRILAVLLLVPFHSAKVFDIFGDFYVKNADHSTWLSWSVVSFLDQWHVPLLFLVAGASTWYALRIRGGKGYVRERLKRLMVPFIFGTLVIVPPQMYYALLYRGSTTASYLGYYPHFFETRSQDQLYHDYVGVGFTWAHLWFILDLFLITVIALPLLLWLRGATGQRVLSRLAGFCERRGAILLLALLFPFVGDVPHFLGKPFIPYLLVFILGFVLVSDARFGRALVRNKEVALILGVLSMSIIYPIWISGTEFVKDSLGDVLFYFLRCMNTWFWLIAILGYGQRYLNANNWVLRYAREAAYPFYVLHQTVIVVLAYYIAQWSVDLNVKYFALVVSALVATVILYDVLVKRTNVTRWLFGMKSKAQAAESKIVLVTVTPR